MIDRTIIIEKDIKKIISIIRQKINLNLLKKKLRHEKD